MEEIPLSDTVPTPPPTLHIQHTHAPVLKMNPFEIMKLLQAAYQSESPQITMEAFLDGYSITTNQLIDLISCVLWGGRSGKEKNQQHPLSMLDQMLKETRHSADYMQPETIKSQFILYSTMLPHIWVKDDALGKVVNLSPKHAPIFYKMTNCKMPYIWLCPNDFGMPKVISSHQPIPFTVSLKRKEARGKMLPLEVPFNDGGGVFLEMEVEMDSEEGFALTNVEKNEAVPDFMLLMTRGSRYLRCILIQPSNGSFLLYPVCVHKIFY